MDDGSTDATAAVCARYAGRIRLIVQPNAGFAAARTRGLDATRAPLAAWHDSDDLMLPGRLAEQVAFLDAHPDVAAVSANAVVEGMDETDYLATCGLDFAGRDALVLDDAFTRLLARNFMVDPATTLRVARFREIGGYDTSLRTGADWDLWLRMARRWPLACLHRAAVRMRKQGDNLSASPAAVECGLRVLDRHLTDAGAIDAATRSAVRARIWEMLANYVITHADTTDLVWRANAARWARHLGPGRRLAVAAAATLSRGPGRFLFALARKAGRSRRRGD